MNARCLLILAVSAFACRSSGGGDATPPADAATPASGQGDAPAAAAGPADAGPDRALATDAALAADAGPDAVVLDTAPDGPMATAEVGPADATGGQAASLDWIQLVTLKSTTLAPAVRLQPADDGDFVLSGSYQGQINVAGMEIIDAAMAPAGQYLHARFSDTGSLRWAHTIAVGCGNNGGGHVTARGDLFMTGNLRCATSFGGAELGVSGATDVFVAAFDKEGKHRWSTVFGGRDTDSGDWIGTDAAGNVYLVGNSETGFQLGGQTIAGRDQAFVASFTAAGAFRWLTPVGNGHWLQMVVRGVDDVVVAGTFSSTLVIGNRTWQPKTLFDLFVAGVGPQGPTWSQAFPGPDEGNQGGYLSGLAADPAGNVYMAGRFLDPATGKKVGVASLSAGGDRRWTAVERGIVSEGTIPAVSVGPEGDLYLLADTYEPGERFAGQTFPTPEAHLGRFRADGTAVWLRDFDHRILRAGSLAVGRDGRISLVAQFYGEKTLLGRNLRADGGSYYGAVLLVLRP